MENDSLETAMLARRVIEVDAGSSNDHTTGGFDEAPRHRKLFPGLCPVIDQQNAIIWLNRITYQFESLAHAGVVDAFIPNRVSSHLPTGSEERESNAQFERHASSKWHPRYLDSHNSIDGSRTERPSKLLYDGGVFPRGGEERR